jgi:hypothetical protein
MRSFAVVAFIAVVGAAALYLAQRPTIARGDVLAADLMRSNAKVLRALECDPEVPIGVDGAKFSCRAEFKLGAVKRIEFALDREGGIKQIGEQAVEEEHPVDPADPWR